MAQLVRRRRYSKVASVPYEPLDWLKLTATSVSTKFTITIGSEVKTTMLSYLEYSIDNGITWTKKNNSNSTVSFQTPFIAPGSHVFLRGSGASTSINTVNTALFSDNSSTYYTQISATAAFSASGNIMSLLYLDSFGSKYSLSGYNGFHWLFYNSTITSAKNLILPALTLSDYCYAGMFASCKSLTQPPLLPATTMKKCCYYRMFNQCTALTSAPNLPSTTLAEGCYQNMFSGCTSLTSAPILKASTLVTNCYSAMFISCTALKYVKALFTTTPGSSYTSQWLYNVAASGTFVKKTGASWNVSGANGIPSGWTVQTANS